MAQTPLPLRFREAPDVPVIGAAHFQPLRSSTRSAHRARKLMEAKAFVTFWMRSRREGPTIHQTSGRRDNLPTPIVRHPKPVQPATRRSRQ